MPDSPTARTLKEMRSLGMTAQVVERWNVHAKIRIDLFGVIDIVGMMPGMGILGVQACAGGSHAARRAKILDEPRARVWIESGGLIELWSWAKQGGAGKRKLWTLRRERIALEDFPLP